MKMKLQIDQDGLPIIGDIQRLKLKEFHYRWATLSVDEEETEGSRKYFEGCLVKLFVFYHGRNWRDSKVCEHAREDIKKHFNGEIVENYFTGKPERIGKSTKTKEVLNRVTEAVTEYLIDHYHAPFESYDSESYKVYRDSIQPYEEDGDYITYLLKEGVLQLPELSTGGIVH